MSSNKVAVVLFNLGGPDKPSSVKPFLFNLFNDKSIINLPQPFRFLLAKLISSRRQKKSQKIYEQIGGKSPLLEITQAQAHELEKELSFFGDFKVFVCMRYWHPMSDKVVQDVVNYRPQQLILLPLYPQFSTTTTESSFKDFAEKFSVAAKKNNLQTVVKRICCYFDEPQFILAHAKMIKQKIEKYAHETQNLRFLFSAHGIPQKLVNEGDPYVLQVSESTKKIIQSLEEILQSKGYKFAPLDFKICYQSKVGPLEWTGPSLDLELRKTILAKKIPVVIPVAFVSEHSETLVELDIDYHNLAKSLGAADYLRVPALNNNGHFINSLKNLCKNASENSQKCFSGCDAQKKCGDKKRCGFVA